MKFSRIFVILMLCLSGTQMLCAQVQDERRDSLDAAVLSGRRPGNYLSKGKPLKVEVISSDGLQKMACCNVAEGFENSASVTVGYSDAVTGARQIRLLGLSGSRGVFRSRSRGAVASGRSGCAILLLDIVSLCFFAAGCKSKHNNCSENQSKEPFHFKPSSFVIICREDYALLPPHLLFYGFSM